MSQFTHLHVHTQYSLLDGAANISKMMKKAKEDGMNSIAITDHGNMFGAFEFVNEAGKNDLKPILGCEFYLVEDRFKKSFTKEAKDNRYHQLLLAKNATGYRNISKLCSLGFIEGMYSKYPRIDKELILKYKEGVIATSCCIGAEVPQAILNKGEAEAEKVFKWWLDVFGEDYYIELQRHHLENIDNTGISQEDINQILLNWSKKYNVKVIATNDSHYINQLDWNAHDILLCINTGDKQNTPKGDGKGFRFGFPNDQFYFKSQQEMRELFKDIPEAIDNTNDIVGKIEPLKLQRDVLLPNFPIPEKFENADDYLRHLTFEGAAKKYGTLSAVVEERLNFELGIIRDMGFAGYFLIVSDFISEGRKMGVMVGPGRGSAAGSAVAYAIGITNIDPIKYDLLFERFLNPERKSMPDIDTDFDDAGRQKVIDYVVKKYGRNQVAQIITYGTMAAKSSIKDVARVMDLPLDESNFLSKLVPDKPGTSFKHVYDMDVKKLEDEGYGPDDIAGILQLREIIKGNDIKSTVLENAKALEGSARNSGIHAAGIIIAPTDITDCIPVATSKDSDLLVTQFDGDVIEKAGLLKMDFLGLKTLTIIKDALVLINNNHGIELNPDEFPLNDQKTYKLFQKGDTNGIFQFESPGMQKYMKELKPDKFEDLIAMNALYRPGPMEYIPNYIRRKHGQEKIAYDIPAMEEYLKDTYGITVYQEQVMLLSQKLAGFSKGDADTLRKAMGKKMITVLNDMKAKFMKGCEERGYELKICEKIWTDWEAFAQYAFNKSHSTCYAFVAYQTAYLKAHYPAEFMASVLTHNQNNIDKITFYMEEAKRMGIPVLGPDINESIANFSVNKKGEIRFGLAAIKGVGEAAVDSIIAERKEKGNFKSIFDISRRINLRSVNKKTFESLAVSGAFDSFEGIHRAQYFFEDSPQTGTLLEKAIRYGANYQEHKNSAQQSLFGEESEVEMPEPEIPNCNPWGRLEELNREKDVTGIYISGHPLDDFRFEIDHFCNCKIEELQDLVKLKGREITFAGIITSVQHKTDKNGKPYARFTIQDYTGAVQLFLGTYGENKYMQFRNYLSENWYLYIKAKVQNRFRSDTELEISVTHIELLQDVRDKMGKSISLFLNLSNITEEYINDLYKAITSYKGNCNVKLIVEDNNENIKVSLPSVKLRVNLSKEFINTLEKSEISFSLN